MHASALHHARQFFFAYGPFRRVAEIGSMVVAGGSLRDASVVAQVETYVGYDIAPGPGVDKVMTDPYRIEAAEAFDAIVSSSTFEHCELFWLLFLEMVRVVRPGGFIYLNAPSNGYVHRHPVDCWRFYPDAAGALTTWAARSGYELELAGTFIGAPDEDVAKWEDWVAVWRRVR